jgi:hypothetical protein
MAYPLDGAFARINRAGEHLKELKRIAEAFGRVYHDAISVGAMPEHLGLLDFRPPNPFPIPEGISIVVGEICYNLRAALDYLVYELARLDSGRVQVGTQFPIEHKKKRFDSISPHRLKGLYPSHVTAIELLQPYRGCDWTATLKEISNPDKHRELTKRGYAGAVWQEDMGENRSTVDPSAADAEVRTIHKAYGPGGTKLDVQLISSFPIHIWVKEQPVPVVQTLRMLQSQVTGVIEGFKPEFQQN